MGPERPGQPQQHAPHSTSPQAPVAIVAGADVDAIIENSGCSKVGRPWVSKKALGYIWQGRPSSLSVPLVCTQDWCVMRRTTTRWRRAWARRVGTSACASRRCWPCSSACKSTASTDHNRHSHSPEMRRRRHLSGWVRAHKMACLSRPHGAPRLTGLSTCHARLAQAPDPDPAGPPGPTPRGRAWYGR
jgi:hypothetical protein